MTRHASILEICNQAGIHKLVTGKNRGRQPVDRELSVARIGNFGSLRLVLVKTVNLINSLTH